MANQDADKQFDVFISYSHKNIEWVRDTLVARLHQEGFSVCLDEDSFDPGRPALVNMENAVAASRRTLLVLTPAWVKSEWTQFESLLIQNEDPAGIRQSTVPLLLESCKTPKRISMLTYVDFRDGVDVEKAFASLLKAIRGESQFAKPQKKRGAAKKGKASQKNNAQINPAVPRPPAVGFIERHDTDGGEILARLQQELAPEKNQLVVLWGEGGVGKSTLAAEAVRRMSALFSGGIVWTSADGRQDYSLATLLDDISAQLGNAELRKLSLELKKEAVQALIASLDGAALVVLDNFETIASAEQKLCGEWLMQQAPCPALITSRDRVAVGHRIPVDVMSDTEAREYLDKLIAQTASQRTFKGIDRDRIIQAADANPLVMLWVIGQIEQAERPNDVLNDLMQGEGDAAERVFDRSFNLPQLGNDGRDALLALSLFAPSASREALATVAGFGDNIRRVREAVRHLAALRLVETTEASERLILKGLTRSLAQSRLSKDSQADEFRRRFIAYFLSYAKSHSETKSEDFDALELEKDNVLGAMDEALGAEDWHSIMQIMFAVGNPAGGFLSLHGYWNEAIKHGEQALTAAAKSKDESRIAAFTHNVGCLYSYRGEYNKARRLYTDSLDINKRLGNQSSVASTLHQLATLAQAQGEIEEARRLYTDSLDIKKRLGNQSGIANTLHNLASLEQDQGEIEEARRLYTDSLDISKRLGNQSGIANTLHQLATLAQDQGEIEEARRLYTDSLDIEERLGNQSGIALSIHQLGRLAEIEGNQTEAVRLFQESLTIFEKLKSPNAAAARRSLDRVQGKG